MIALLSLVAGACIGFFVGSVCRGGAEDDRQRDAFLAGQNYERIFGPDVIPIERAVERRSAGVAWR